MLDIAAWVRRFLAALDETFGGRVWFAGLQGSYGRSEATETSDIDMVVILDRLSPADIRAYGRMLDGLPQRALACGFLSGQAELLRWDAADLFQFYQDTTPLRGSLDALLPRLTDEAVDRAIRRGACDLYHACVHNLVHGRDPAVLPGLYKGASFVIRALHFRRTGQYLARLSELLPAVAAPERAILQTLLELKAGAPARLDAMSDALFLWLQSILQN